MPYSKRFFVLACIFLTALVLTSVISSCGSNSRQQDGQKSGQQLSNKQEQEKAPKDLEKIEKSVERIIKLLEGPSVTEEEQFSEGQEEESGQDFGQDSGSGTSSQQSPENQNQKPQQAGKDNGGNTQESQQKPEFKKDPWKDLTPVINKLHYMWNDYMPLAVEKGTKKALADNFSTALNSLTEAIIQKNKTKTLMAASYLYAYIPDFYSLYGDNKTTDIKRIRHYARNAILNGYAKNWKQAQTDMENLDLTWNILKRTFDKKHAEKAAKLDLSVYELLKVVNVENGSLTDIKGRITLHNIMELEKSIEEEELGNMGSQ